MGANHGGNGNDEEELRNIFGKPEFKRKRKLPQLNWWHSRHDQTQLSGRHSQLNNGKCAIMAGVGEKKEKTGP